MQILMTLLTLFLCNVDWTQYIGQPVEADLNRKKGRETVSASVKLPPLSPLRQKSPLPLIFGPITGSGYNIVKATIFNFYQLFF